MTEIKDGKRIIHEPVEAGDISGLRAGDIFYYSGELVTCRDDAHNRVICEGMDFPVDISEKAIFHAGPIIKKDSHGKYEAYSIGPTTSMRMEKWEHDFMEKTGVRIIIGKGGMGEKTQDACSKFGGIVCIMPAGCAVVGAVCTEEVIDCYWPELGMPEACWHLRVKELGPLTVSIDASGHNFFNPT